MATIGLHSFLSPRALPAWDRRYHLESSGEKQYKEDNDQHPGEARWCIAIRVITKVRECAHQ
jgi:hypothetical protein